MIEEKRGPRNLIGFGSVTSEPPRILGTSERRRYRVDTNRASHRASTAEPGDFAELRNRTSRRPLLRVARSRHTEVQCFLLETSNQAKTAPLLPACRQLSEPSRWSSWSRVVVSSTVAKASRYRAAALWESWARRCKSAMPRRSRRQARGPLRSPLLAPINAKVVSVMKGGLGAQDAAVGSIGLIVELHGVAVDAVLDAHSLGPAFEVADHLSGEVLV
jgi:hypothetical protein